MKHHYGNSIDLRPLLILVVIIIWTIDLYSPNHRQIVHPTRIREMNVIIREEMLAFFLLSMAHAFAQPDIGLDCRWTEL